jgi:lysophospholipase L1-like esterase
MKRRLLLGLAVLAALTFIAPANAQAGTPSPLKLPAHPRVLILGDSYTEGYGASPATEAWAYKVGAPLSWQVTVDGVGGSGYVNPGPTGTYNTRLWRRPADAYDLVVLQGGSNDARGQYPNGEIAGGVNQAIRTVQRHFPHARLIIMGATTPYGAAGRDRVLINGITKRYASTYSLPYVDPAGEAWFDRTVGKAYTDPATGHPNNAGYQLMADRFVQDVKTY